MKKLFLTAITCYIAVSLSAQFQKGQRIILGNVGFNTNKTEHAPNAPLGFLMANNSNTSVSGNVSLGCFKSPLSIRSYGLGLSAYSRETDNTTLKTTTLGSQLFMEDTRLFSFFPKAYFMLGIRYAAHFTSESSKTIATGKERFKGYGLGLSTGLSGGVMYQASNRILVSFNVANFAGIAFNHRELRSEIGTPAEFKSKNNEFSLFAGTGQNNLGNVGFGISWLLKNKKG